MQTRSGLADQVAAQARKCRLRIRYRKRGQYAERDNRHLEDIGPPGDEIVADIARFAAVRLKGGSERDIVDAELAQFHGRMPRRDVLCWQRLR